MLFIFLLHLLLSSSIHSKFTTYTLYQTNDICQYNWKGSICLPIFSLNKTNQPLLIKLDINNLNQCLTQTLVYIRSRKCIYCAINFQDIHCNHQRLRRMIPTTKEHTYRNSIGIIFISLLGILTIGSLFTLIFIKRSQAHTNLLELFNQIKVPQNIKSVDINPTQPIRSTVPKQIKSTK